MQRRGPVRDGWDVGLSPRKLCPLWLFLTSSERTMALKTDYPLQDSCGPSSLSEVKLTAKPPYLLGVQAKVKGSWCHPKGDLVGKKDGELWRQVRWYWSDFLDSALIKRALERETAWSICLEALQMPRVTAVSSTSRRALCPSVKASGVGGVLDPSFGAST